MYLLVQCSFSANVFVWIFEIGMILFLGRTEKNSVHKALTHIINMVRPDNNMVVYTLSSHQSIVFYLSKSTLESSDLSRCVFIDSESRTRSTSNRNYNVMGRTNDGNDLSNDIFSNDSQYKNYMIVW